MLTTIFAMDTIGLMTFIGATIVLCLTPGSDMMFIIASGISGGARAALMAVSGIIVGVMTHIIIAAAGLTLLIIAYPAILTIVQYIGASYLLWLAFTSWSASAAPDQRRGRAQSWPAFRRGFLTNILNPKVSLFILALLPQFTDPSIGPVWHQILFLGFIMCVIGFVLDGVIGVFAGILADQLAQYQLHLNRLAALVFFGVAVKLIIPN